MCYFINYVVIMFFSQCLDDMFSLFLQIVVLNSLILMCCIFPEFYIAVFKIYNIFSTLFVYVCMYALMHMCSCLCVCVCARVRVRACVREHVRSCVLCPFHVLSRG